MESIQIILIYSFNISFWRPTATHCSGAETFQGTRQQSSLPSWSVHSSCQEKTIKASTTNNSNISHNYICGWMMSMVNCQGGGTLILNSSCFQEGGCSPEHTASCPDWWAWDEELGGPLLDSFFFYPFLGARLSYTSFLASLLEKFSGDNFNRKSCGCPLCLWLCGFV